MALLSGRSFSLNPNAPVFIPFALRNVEDFSPEWWQLVKTSPWFRDYWLSQHQEDDINSIIGDDLVDAEEFLDLEEAEFEDMIQSIEADEKLEVDQMGLNNHTKGSEVDAKKVLKDLAIPKSPKNRGPKSQVGPSKYNVKPAKCMSPKRTPKFIHQPR